MESKVKLIPVLSGEPKYFDASHAERIMAHPQWSKFWKKETSSERVGEVEKVDEEKPNGDKTGDFRSREKATQTERK